MKRIMIFAAFAAALTLSSCMKENPSADAPSGAHTVYFTAVSPITKTVFGQDSGEGYPVLWQDTDEIGIVVNKNQDKTSAQVEPSSDASSASFSATWTEQTTTPATFTLISPNTSLKTWSNDSQFLVEIPSSQTPTADGPDPSAQILYALKENVTDFSNVVDVQFSHLTAYLHINFKNANLDGGTVQAINVTCSGNGNDRLIAGRFNYKYDGGFDGSGSSRFNTISITTNTPENVWCAVRPIDFSGQTLNFTIVTDKGTLSRDVTMPASANLAAGHIAKFTVNMSTATAGDLVFYDLVTSKDALHWGDNVIIATALEDYPFAIGNGQNTNNRSGVGVTISGDCIANPTGIVEILKIEDGAIPGYYALHATKKSGYLYAANISSTNSLRTKNEIDLAATWDISFGNATYSNNNYNNCAIIQSKTTETSRNLLRFNPGDCLFTVYGNTNWGPVRMYRERQQTSDSNPRFNVTLPNGNKISSAAQDIPVYVFGNVDWTAEVTGTGASLSVDSGTGPAILTLSIPENTDSRFKSYTVSVSTSDSASQQLYSFNVKQEEPLVEGTILFHEYWQGGQADDKVADYLARAEHSTRVFGGADLVYSSDSKSKLYNTGTVYLGSGHTIDELPESARINIRIQDRNGYWKIQGVPCKGVKKANIVFRINRSGSYYTVTSPTSGITLGTRQEKELTSSWGKKYYEITYPIEFSSNLETFDFQINDTYTNSDTSVTRHIYLTDAQVIVAELY